MPASVIDQVVRLHRAQLAGIVELGGVRKTMALYEQARSEIEAKLAVLRRAGEGMTFSAQHMRMILLQINDGLRSFRQDFGPELSKQSRTAADLARHHLVTAIRKLEKRYSGIEPVLQVEEASVFSGLYKGIEPSLLNRHRTLMSAYSLPTIERVKRQLALSLIQGENLDHVIDRVAGAGGIVDAERWRAARIARTEMSYAYGQTSQRCMVETAKEIPDLCKRLAATFDNRTGADSIALNGQVQPVSAPFVWMKKTKSGVERVEYMAPPNRPNDRECVVPWRAAYPEPSARPGPVTPTLPR